MFGPSFTPDYIQFWPSTLYHMTITQSTTMDCCKLRLISTTLPNLCLLTVKVLFVNKLQKTSLQPLGKITRLSHFQENLWPKKENQSLNGHITNQQGLATRMPVCTYIAQNWKTAEVEWKTTTTKQKTCWPEEKQSTGRCSASSLINDYNLHVYVTGQN